MKTTSILYGGLLFFAVAAGTSLKAQSAQLAPNSYIFDINSANDGLKIPVAKAYHIWQSNSLFSGQAVPSGTAKAYVYWEDQPGLIKANADYELSLEGSGSSAMIKVPVNKFKEGNAVIAYEVNGEIFWSWHVWVTDNPVQNGADYISVSSFSVQKRSNTGEVTDIPQSDWKWMDRNLGATSAELTGPDWNRNGGLLYQWGRKDPMPPLATKGNDFYEVSGKVGRVRHAHARNFLNGATSFENLKILAQRSASNIQANIQLATKNPLSLIYVVNDGTTNQAFYSNNTNNPLNWFGRSSTYTDDRIAEHNLWSDNSLGQKPTYNNTHNNESARKPYRDKSAFDPCPNGWRVPSMLVAMQGNPSYLDDLRSDYSPFGYHNRIENHFVNQTVKPTNAGMQGYQTDIKVYPQIGFDLSNVNMKNMGIFPGTGVIYRDMQNSVYTDQHETFLWTATMTRWYDASPSVSARALRMVPDAERDDLTPDTNFPSITGKFTISNSRDQTSNAYGVRCVKDPVYMLNNYDFPTIFYTDSTEKFEAGLDDPNTYALVKSQNPQTLNIPIRKAFSVQSNLLANPEVLNPSGFDDVKVNVLWTTNQNLVQEVNVAQPANLASIDGSDITVKINPGQSGNAVVTLHNGSFTNPVLWSWHIWVTNSPLTSVIYQNDTGVNSSATNYINYLKRGTVMLTAIMDRNLGAVDHLHWVNNPNSLSPEDQESIKNSGGLQYQWGRKDPLPSFTNPDGSSFVIYLGNNSGGNLTYTSLDASQYLANYSNEYDTYSVASGVSPTDPIAQKIAKIIRYSAAKPLEFLKPSSFAAQANPALHTNGTDWLSPAGEPNLAADRWGRGGKKSPFDPCPEGWRIPDVYSNETGNQLSKMPWSLKSVLADEPKSIVGTYSGTVHNSSGTWFSRSSQYKIGNFPFVGIRGWRNVLQGGAANFGISSNFTGIWTAALNSNYLGRAVGLLIDRGAGNLLPYSPGLDPYFAMNCRCVEIRLDSNGKEIGPILTDHIYTYNHTGNYDDTLLVQEIDASTAESAITVYPNPFAQHVTIDSRELKLTSPYSVYDATGKVVATGMLRGKAQIELSHLPSGLYIIRIDGAKKAFKVLKK